MKINSNLHKLTLLTILLASSSSKQRLIFHVYSQPFSSSFSKKILCFLTDKKNQLCFTEMSHLCSRQHAGIRWWIKNCVIFKYFVPFNTVFSHNLYHPFWFEYSLMTGQLNFFWGNLVFKFQLCPHREQWLDLWT